MTVEQSNIVGAYAREITAAIRHALGLTGPVAPGWYRPWDLSIAQSERVRRATLPIIDRLGVQLRLLAAHP